MYFSFALTKIQAMHLIRMSAKRLLGRVAAYTSNPEEFIRKDNRDGVENRRIQLVSEWVMNQLIKGVVTSHIKMARLEWIAAIHAGNQPEPKTSLDHQQTTSLVMTAFGTGIFKSRIMPALIASQAKAGKKAFQAPDQHRRPNNNNNTKQAKDRTGITQVQNNTNLFSMWSQQVRINGNLQSTGGANSSAREILGWFKAALYNQVDQIVQQCTNEIYVYFIAIFVLQMILGSWILSRLQITRVVVSSSRMPCILVFQWTI
jgi:DNA-directed RNA polymerase beta subunit